MGLIEYEGKGGFTPKDDWYKSLSFLHWLNAYLYPPLLPRFLIPFLIATFYLAATHTQYQSPNTTTYLLSIMVFGWG